MMKSLLRSRWLVLAIMICARTGVGFQFIAIATLMPQLRAELQLNYTQIGLLLGVFMIAGVFLSLPSGMIADHLGSRRTLQAGLASLVLGSIIMGGSTTFLMAFAGRAMGGVGAVLITVTAAKMLTDWFAGKEITTAMSLLGVTWPVGIALGMSLHPLINTWEGWRTAVYVTVGLPAVSMLFVSILPTSPPQDNPVTQTSVASTSLWSIRPRELWTILAGGAAWPLMSSGGYVVFSSYAPGLLIERGVSQTIAGLYISLLSWLIIVTIPLGGYLADRTGRGDLMFYGGCLAAAGAIAMVPLTEPLILWIILSAALGVTVGPVMALPTEVLSLESRGTGLGLFYTFYYLGTGGLPALAGWFQDATGSAAMVVWFSAFCLLIAPSFLLVFRLLQRRWQLGVSESVP